MSLMLILNENGNPIEGENGTVLVRDIATDSYLYISKSTISMENEVSQEQEIETENRPFEAQSPEQGVSRTNWTRQQIIALIESYKKYKHLFDQTQVRNSTVWNKIATDIGHHTGIEVMNKFKYLKSKYTKKKDNMGASSSGAKLIHFEYFDIMDEIFGKDPNILPTAIASSSRVETVHQESETGETSASDGNKQNKKRKRRDDDLLDFLREKEEARERRHQESLEALNKFNSLMEQLIKK